MAHKGIKRDDLAGEHPFWDLLQIFLLIIFFIIWIYDSFIFRYSVFLSAHIPLFLRIIISGILFLIAGYFSVTALKIIFKEVRTPPAVIEKSVFTIVRHPLYFASLLFYTGFIILTLSLISFAFFIIVFILHDREAVYEENKLKEKFGTEYISYMKRVHRWLPFC